MGFRILLCPCPSVRDGISEGLEAIQHGRRFLDLDALESRLGRRLGDAEVSLDGFVLDEPGLQEGERV